MGIPLNAWFIRENPIQTDDDWGYPYFRKPPIILYIHVYPHLCISLCLISCCFISIIYRSVIGMKGDESVFCPGSWLIIFSPWYCGIRAGSVAEAGGGSPRLYYFLSHEGSLKQCPWHVEGVNITCSYCLVQRRLLSCATSPHSTHFRQCKGKSGNPPHVLRLWEKHKFIEQIDEFSQLH